jgi:hypothetical protein
MAKYTILYWKHIPSMIRVSEGAEEVEVSLGERFEALIDDAATKAARPARTITSTAGTSPKSRNAPVRPPTSLPRSRASWRRRNTRSRRCKRYRRNSSGQTDF